MAWQRACGLLLLLSLSPAPAWAHLGLIEPPSRYGPDVLKYGPCGRVGGTRSANVTVLEPGATIEVAWDEYVNHPGHFRISFDEDGEDDFVNPACLSNCSGRSMDIELYSNDAVLLDGIPDTQGGESRVEIELPDVECDRCTLQVIQVMTDKPPYVVPGNDIYYQCADLVLRRGAADGGSAGTGGAPNTGGAGSSAGGSVSSTGGSESGGGGTFLDGGTPHRHDASSDGGCRTAPGMNRGAFGSFVLGFLVAALSLHARRLGRPSSLR